MSRVFICWWEIQDGAFPDCCMTCGAEDTELVPRRLETNHYRVVFMTRRYITVDLPFCDAHRSRPWISLGRTEATEFTKEGVWIKNVSEIFIEEMEAFRDEEIDYDNRPRRRKQKKKRRQYTSEEREEQRRRPHTPPKSSSLVPFVILAVVLVPVLFIAMCCVAGMFLPGVKFGVQQGVQQPPGPNFNNRPPFGPLRRP